MTTGFRNGAGADFDDIFDLYVQGTKPASTGFITVDGVDLANRYAPLSFGAQAAATGLKIANDTDLNTLWAAKGTAVYETVSLGNLTASCNTITPTNATAVYSIAADGDIDATNGTNTVVDRGDWITPKSAAANYQLRGTLLSGAITSGSFGAWQEVGTGWTKTLTSNGTSTAQVLVEIRRKSDLTVVGSATITLSTTREPG